MNSEHPAEVSAALELAGIKYHQLSRAECHETSELLCTILQRTDPDGTLSLNQLTFQSSSGRRPSTAALLIAAGDAYGAVNLYTSSVSSVITKMPIPIAGRDDEQYLSTLQCYIRKTCLEYFAASAASARNLTTKGRQTLVSEVRVGVRCVFCKHLPRDQQAKQASEFLSFLSLHSFMHIPVFISRHFRPPSSSIHPSVVP